MGTIQPSRFLSHTGRILPGVRRVFTIPQPAANTGVTFTVPGGVQWWVGAGYWSLLTDAVVGNRFITCNVTVDDVQVWAVWSGFSQTASTNINYMMQSTNAYATSANSGNRSILTLPGEYLPEGSTVSLTLNGSDVGDQLSAVNVWVEEVYITDPQLSEIARTQRELDREIAMYEYEQATQG